MLSDMFKQLFGISNKDVLQGDGETFGNLGLPRCVEDDLRQRYISNLDETDDHINPCAPVHGTGRQNHELHTQPMDPMFNEIQELFQSIFGAHESDEIFKFSFNHEMPSDNEYNSDPRSRMFNDKEGFENSPNLWLYQFNSPYSRPIRNAPDQDLDSEVGKGKISIDSILQSENKTRYDVSQGKPSDDADYFSTPLPDMTSSFKFSSVTTTQQRDGTMESKTTTQDSAGNQEVFVERTIGDKTHAIKRTIDQSGTEKIVEQFINMDQGETKDFEEKWQNLRGEPSVMPPDTVMSLPHNKSNGIFNNIKQLFGL